MRGAVSEPGDSLDVLAPHAREKPAIYSIHHGLKAPVSRLSISWSRGNCLAITYFCDNAQGSTGGSEEETGGSVVEVKLNAGEGGIDDAEKRRIVYGSAPPFAMLQTKKHAFLSMAKASSQRVEWWPYVLDYSKTIGSLLGTSTIQSDSLIEDPKVVMKAAEEPTCLKAAWELIEIFFVDKESHTWLPERLVDWLAEYDRLLSSSESTAYSELVSLQKKLLDLQVIENDPEYWDGLSLALSIGWLDIVVKLLRLHGSYQLDQLGSRETENGLVEAVAVLVSTMPRLRRNLPEGTLGQCFATKSDFVKAWERWRSQIAKLECSTFWVHCHHYQTKDGLRRLLQMMMGNLSRLTSVTCHWMELYIAHFLFSRPFAMSLEGMLGLAQQCVQLKQPSDSDEFTRLMFGILTETTEVVLSECSNAFGPWMVVHAMELLAANNAITKALLCEERYNLGEVSIEELHRIVYAQMLSSHDLTLQIASIYLSFCQKQGFGLLEHLLCKHPLYYNHVILKLLDICRLYGLEHISSMIMKIAGVYHWKHGRKGPGVYWLHQAQDDVRLSRISQQLFDFVGQSISDDRFKQWEGVIQLLSSEMGTSGLEFLHKYVEFKKCLQQVEHGSSDDAAHQAAQFLILLMKTPSTPERFWLPLLHDSLLLLNWAEKPLFNVSETNLLLSKVQGLCLRRLHPDFKDAELPAKALSSVRLALARNLGRSFVEE